MPFHSSKSESSGGSAEQNEICPEKESGRRSFLKSSFLLSFLVLPSCNGLFSDFFAGRNKRVYPSKRPVPSDRTYYSQGLEENLKAVKLRIHDPEIAWLFENTYPRILDRQISFSEAGGNAHTFIYGQNDCSMHLAESCLQVFPYLNLSKDPSLSRLFEGLIRRQAELILTDPYSSEFLHSGEPLKQVLSNWNSSSLCYPVHLAWQFWKFSGGNVKAFDKTWEKSLELILMTFQERLIPLGKNSALVSSLTFIKPGLTLYPLHVPLNIMLSHCLTELAEMANLILNRADLAERASALNEQIKLGLKNNAVLYHPQFGNVYAWEVDRSGNTVIHENAEETGWLELGIRGFADKRDPIYRNTCRASWSEYNAYFKEGEPAGLRGPGNGVDQVFNSSILKSYLIDPYLLVTEKSSKSRQLLYNLKQMGNGSGFITKYSGESQRTTSPDCLLTNAIFSELILRYDRILDNDLTDSKKYFIRESGKFA